MSKRDSKATTEDHKVHETQGIRWWVDEDGQLHHDGTPTPGTLTADLYAALGSGADYSP